MPVVELARVPMLNMWWWEKVVIVFLCRSIEMLMGFAQQLSDSYWMPFSLFTVIPLQHAICSCNVFSSQPWPLSVLCSRGPFHTQCPDLSGILWPLRQFTRRSTNFILFRAIWWECLFPVGRRHERSSSLEKGWYPGFEMFRTRNAFWPLIQRSSTTLSICDRSPVDPGSSKSKFARDMSSLTGRIEGAKKRAGQARQCFRMNISEKDNQALC